MSGNWGDLSRPVLRPDRLGTRRTTPTVVCEMIWCPGGWPWVFADATAASETGCWQTATKRYGWAEDWIGRRACPACAQRPEFRPAPATHLPVPYERPVVRRERLAHIRVTVAEPPPPAPVTADTVVLEALRITATTADLSAWAADLQDWPVAPDDTPLPDRRWRLGRRNAS